MSIDVAFDHFPVLTTPRLVLRELRPTDAEAFYAILADPEVMRYYGSEAHESLTQTRALIARLQKSYGHRLSMRWAVTLAREDRLIGSVSFWHFDEDYQRAETGYDLHPAFWGQGIMAEALSAVLTYGFTEMNLHRVEANIDMQNERSKRLLLKLGFTYEGRLRERFFFRGQFEDEYYFGLLRQEWLATHAGGID